MMLNIHLPQPPLYLKSTALPATSPALKPHPIFHHYPSSPFSLLRVCCTNHISHSPSSFAVSYLIHNLGFSPQSASKLCSTYKVRFKTAENPDSVLAFFRNHGFSESQVHNLIRKAPWLLSCDPCKRVLPKFEFFLSKGASASDIVNLVSKYPNILSPSLENQLVPAYDLVNRLLQSDKDTITLLIHNPSWFSYRLLAPSIRMLIENGVADSNIARVLPRIRRTICTRDLLKIVEELKYLGFNPSKSAFGTALKAKTAVPRTLWKEKCDAFKKWGWSDEHILEAFKKRPDCMITSIDKINLVMNFWVNHLGWDALALAKVPKVLEYSLEGRIIPRASVIQFLLKKGLRRKNASLTSPFLIRDELFLDRFIKRFKEESSHLLNLYEEKLNLACTRDKTDIS